MKLRRRRVAERGGAQETSASWMVTFSDLMTLLLTFFVLRLSMSSLDAISLAEVFRGEQVPDAQVDHVADIIERVRAELALRLPNREFERVVQIGPRVDGAIISLAGATFVSGSDSLSPIAQTIVDGIATALRDQHVDFIVSGHTDDVPIKRVRFPSNWELSGARAIAVAKRLVEQRIDAASIAAVGYADTKPITGNDTPQGQARNRRVEVKVQVRQAVAD